MKKEIIDFLIVAPFDTLGQKQYYYERKKMLEEMGFSCRILNLKDNNFMRYLYLPYPYNLFKLGLNYRIAINSLLKNINPKIIEFQNNTAIFQSNNIFRRYKTIISFDYPSQLKLPWYCFFIKHLEIRRFKKSNIIIGRSEYALRYLKKKNITNSFFIPHSINNYQRKLKVGNKNYILYYCSPKCPYEKGLDIAINFWEAYSKENIKIELEIVGISKEDALRYLNKKILSY